MCSWLKIELKNTSSKLRFSVILIALLSLVVFYGFRYFQKSYGLVWSNVDEQTLLLIVTLA